MNEDQINQNIDELFNQPVERLRAMAALAQEGASTIPPTVQIGDFFYMRWPDNSHPGLESIHCFDRPRDEGGNNQWTFSGDREGVGRWTDEELAQVSAVLARYPRPHPRPGHGVANWYLWKISPASIESDQRLKYSIGVQSASQVDYVRALHQRDLTELLKIWETIQANRG